MLHGRELLGSWGDRGSARVTGKEVDPTIKVHVQRGPTCGNNPGTF